MYHMCQVNNYAYRYGSTVQGKYFFQLVDVCIIAKLKYNYPQLDLQLDCQNAHQSQVCLSGTGRMCKPLQLKPIYMSQHISNTIG